MSTGKIVEKWGKEFVAWWMEQPSMLNFDAMSAWVETWLIEKGITLTFNQRYTFDAAARTEVNRLLKRG